MKFPMGNNARRGRVGGLNLKMNVRVFAGCQTHESPTVYSPCVCVCVCVCVARARTRICKIQYIKLKRYLIRYTFVRVIARYWIVTRRVIFFLLSLSLSLSFFFFSSDAAGNFPLKYQSPCFYTSSTFDRWKLFARYREAYQAYPLRRDRSLKENSLPINLMQR